MDFSMGAALPIIGDGLGISPGNLQSLTGVAGKPDDDFGVRSSYLESLVNSTGPDYQPGEADHEWATNRQVQVRRLLLGRIDDRRGSHRRPRPARR